jgi:hypothetical protein
LAISALAAAEKAPALAHLSSLLQESTSRLNAIQPILPPPLRQSIQPGPIDDKDWCLLVNGAAASAKIRQLIPAIDRKLAEQGFRPLPIRLKILITKK